MSDEFTEQHARMLLLSQLVHAPVRDVLAVELSDDSAARFEALASIDADTLSSSAKRTREAIDDVQSGLTASAYHYRNVLRIEEDVVTRCREAYARAPSGLLQAPATMGLQANKLDFEYHAFLFAIRRTLEYLARGVAAYFGRSSKSFRALPKTLNGAEPADLAEAVVKRSETALDSLEDVLGRPDARPPRDRIAHSRPEVPGTLNLTFSPDGSIGMHLAGGAEEFDLFFPPGHAEPKLAPLLAERCVRIERVAFELLLELPEFQEAAAKALNG